MSIYKEPPPGMFVVPDPQDMTKVKSEEQSIFGILSISNTDLTHFLINRFFCHQNV